jgi:DNA-binding Lrp family transcriptional regulator
VNAFLYLRADPARIDDVVSALAQTPGVRRAVSVTGAWDVLAAMEGADFASIAATIKREVLPIEGVTRSLTAPVVPLDVIGVHGGGWATPGVPLTSGEPACYVHVRAQPGSIAGLVEALGELDEVTGIAVLAGEDDVLLEVPGSWEDASRVVLEAIHALPGVERTNTSIAVGAATARPA